jgi:hypothetical protein
MDMDCDLVLLVADFALDGLLRSNGPNVRVDSPLTRSVYGESKRRRAFFQEAVDEVVKRSDEASTWHLGQGPG